MSWFEIFIIYVACIVILVIILGLASLYNAHMMRKEFAELKAKMRAETERLIQEIDR
jgi:hypothetical protein